MFLLLPYKNPIKKGGERKGKDDSPAGFLLSFGVERGGGGCPSKEPTSTVGRRRKKKKRGEGKKGKRSKWVPRRGHRRSFPLIYKTRPFVGKKKKKEKRKGRRKRRGRIELVRSRRTQSPFEPLLAKKGKKEGEEEGKSNSCGLLIFAAKRTQCL